MAPQNFMTPCRRNIKQIRNFKVLAGCMELLNHCASKRNFKISSGKLRYIGGIMGPRGGGGSAAELNSCSSSKLILNLFVSGK